MITFTYISHNDKRNVLSKIDKIQLKLKHVVIISSIELLVRPSGK